jgi:formylglycine-generating enzyme required for sulfatase activity
MTKAYDDELPEHEAIVATFALDKFEVTVGRFRKFVEAFRAWHVQSGAPVAHAGLGNAPSTGWDAGWNSKLPGDYTALVANLKECKPHTWTDEAEENEIRPINCVSWYEAFAFCIWDGGRLPTEAEWEYAAAGGALNQLYPWGDSKQPPDETRANFGASGTMPLTIVGSFADGANHWGHMDMAGSVWEWIFDSYSDSYYQVTQASCANCANTANGDAAGNRGYRGGSWANAKNYLRAAARGKGAPDDRSSEVGIRCARSLPTR